MTETEAKTALELAHSLIGDKPISGLRLKNTAKFFVAEADGGLMDVTGLLARALGRTLSKYGWICRVNAGYDLRDYIVESYYKALQSKGLRDEKLPRHFNL